MELEGNQKNQQVRQVPNILITGTPGVGKTTLGKLLSEYVEGLRYYNVGELVNQYKLYQKIDDKFGVPEFDEDMVVDFLETEIQKGGCVVDFHSSNFFPERWFDMVFLLRTNNTVLFDRLSARGYSQQKIDENIECEILEVTSEEVYESYNKDIICELQSVTEGDVQNNIQTIITALQNYKQRLQQ